MRETALGRKNSFSILFAIVFLSFSSGHVIIYCVGCSGNNTSVTMLLTPTRTDLELIALRAIGLCFTAKEVQQSHQLMLDWHLSPSSFALHEHIVGFYLPCNPIQCIPRASFSQ
jgi:hypothetical protein